MLVAICVVAADVDKTRAFYTDIIGGELLMGGIPSIVKVGSSWIGITIGGGPTADKPQVVLKPNRDPSTVGTFLMLRVADADAEYERMKAAGAEFLTPPISKDGEKRCYLRDPDDNLIEINESVGSDRPAWGSSGGSSDG